MKKINRIVAFVLSVTLLITCSNSANLFHAAEISGQDVSASVTGEDDLMVEGTNSFGSLLANELATELEEQEENNGCNVFSVEMYDNVAAVTFETTQYAMLVVGIYDETGTAMLATGEFEVMPGETEAYVDINIETMPEYFYVRVFLIDEASMRPLCTACESAMYTQEMQEFLSKTTDDFDADKVLNLDDDKTNNFAVYSDDTILIPESDVYNKVTQCDEENNTYIIENIDSNILNLQAGDIFSYEHDEEVLIVKVASIRIDGTTATIMGEDTSMEEVFDYVKIDETSNTQEITVDESTCEEGVIYEGDVEMKDVEDTPENYALDVNGGVSYAKKFSFIDKELDDNAKLSGSIELKIDASIKLYIAKKSQYMEVKLDYKAQAQLSFSEKIEERSLPLAYFEVCPAPGVYIKFTPSIVVEVDAEIEVNAQIYGTIGFRASVQEGMKNLTTTPKFKAELKGEITVFVGLSMKPQITIVTEKLADASLTAKVGAEAKGKTIYSAESDTTSAPNEIHDCTSCIDGDIHAKAAVEFKANIFDSDNMTFKLSKTWSTKIADFYFSYDYGEFGFTSCPHYKYKIMFNVVSLDGKNMYNASIKIAGEKITILTEEGEEEEVEEIFTDEEGKAEGYLSSGKYKMLVAKLGYISEKQEITIENKAASKFVWMEIFRNVDNSGSNEGNEEDKGENGDEAICNISQTFTLGSQVSAVVTEDGSLYMWGINTCGQIGNGTIEEQLMPIKVLENVAFVSFGGGYGHSGAITEDGSLYMWGYNEFGQVGNGSIENQLTPQKVLENVVYVSLGARHSGAITQDGSLYMWGENEFGQVGDGSGENQLVPIKVMENVISVSLGYCHSGAITEDGGLYMWGWNERGGVGNGNEENQFIPQKVMDNVISVSLGIFHSGAITQDGSLYMWGENYDGQVGNGIVRRSEVIPVKVLDNVKSVLLKDYHSSAITKDGSLYMWGKNSDGQVGNGSEDNDQLIPIKVLDNVISVSLGSFHSGAITEDGSLYMWGQNWDGEVGTGSKRKCVPEKVIDGVISVSLGGNHSGAITKDGNLYMWGANAYGQIGNGTKESQHFPLKIMDNVTVPIFSNVVESQQMISRSLFSAQYFSNNNVIQIIEFLDLTPNETYNFYIMKDKESTEPFTSENLLYIIQAISDDTGNLTISYEPTKEVDNADIFVVQMSQTDLSSAKVELSDLQYTGELLYVNPIVTLNGTVLTEGKDYELLGAYSALETGKYTVTVHGVGLYTGAITIIYHVYSDESIRLLEQLENADAGSSIKVTMKNTTVLSQKALELIREKELTFIADLNEEMTWTINGGAINADELHDTDILVTKTAKEDGNIPIDIITSIAGTRSAEQLIFAHNTAFDFVGEFTMEMADTIRGNKGVLLQISSTDENLEFADSAQIIEDAISFEVGRGADSVIVYGINGDINNDNTVNIKDMMQMLHHISSRNKLNEVGKAFADVDMNNTVNLRDLMRTMHYVSGRSNELVTVE